MRRMLIIFVAVLGCHALLASDNPSEAKIADALKGWKTVELKFVASEGDYGSVYSVRFHWLDADTIIVDREQGPPERVKGQFATTGLLSAAQGQKLIEQAVAIYRRSLLEVSEMERYLKLSEAEQSAYAAKQPFGIRFRNLVVQVTNQDGSYELTHTCDPESATAKEFGELVFKLKTSTE